MEMDPTTVLLLVAGGALAGVINTLAGGGSLLTVPLLVLLDVPGTVANGTNRVGVLVQNATAVWRFRKEGVDGFQQALPVLIPVLLGSAVGAVWVAGLSDESFERGFGIVMLLLLIPTLRPPKQDAARPWPPWLRTLLFFGVGLYGGAFQAGVGILLVMALARSGTGLLESNSIKVVIVGVLTAVAVPVFWWSGQILWLPGLVLAAGTALGAAVGVRIAVLGGDKVIRPVLVLSVVAMAGRMLGLY